MSRLKGCAVIVTGATSGFGEAIAKTLATKGAHLALGGRRVDRLADLKEEIESKGRSGRVIAMALDVRDPKSVAKFVKATVSELGRLDVLINNAGLALGRQPIKDAEEADWETMMQTNFLGVFRMTREAIPHMLERKDGHIINIGSIAGHFAYEGGGGYCASKFALTAMTRILRMELVGTGIKVSSVNPGMAETEFSLVRFDGDAQAAKKVYDGMSPLTATDIAETVHFILNRPRHVNIDDVLLTSIDQGGVTKVHRKK